MIFLAKSRERKDQKYSIISVCDWNGKYLGKVSVIRPYELEHVMVYEGKIYFGVLDYHGRGDRYRNAYAGVVTGWK